MASVKLEDVYITQALAIELLDAGIVTSVFESNIRRIPNDQNQWAYRWDILMSDVHVLYSTRITPEDDLARILMLMPTTEARLYYLNNH